ncbi:MAG TPA: hypothetical protein VFY13_00895, partial [Luteolibacter sp.]|nr:hypothetical protein [Luteolibacter sp.]
MSENTPSQQASMPESLRLQLEDFKRQLWRIKVLEAVAAGLIGLLVSFLLVYGLDRFVPTPGWLRLLLLLAGCSLFALFAPYWIHRWVWQRRRQNQLARLIARRYPGLGDRLLGVIELQSQNEAQDTLSPRLREAAFAAVAAEAGKRPLQEALPNPRHRLWSLAALMLLAGAGAALLLTPKAGVNALHRWLMPLSDTQRYTFTRLQDAPTQLKVAKGEAFEIHLKLAADSEQRPQRASARFGMQNPLSADLKDENYEFKFPGQQDSGKITFRIGDLVHELEVIPRERPKVMSIWAKLTPPAYLGLPPRRASLHTGGLSAVQGSHLSIEMDMSEPLAQAHSLGGVDASGKPLPSTTRTPLIIDGHHASTRPIPIHRDDFEIPFDWVDTNGLGGGSGFKLRIDSVEDAAPTCYTQGINRQHLMLPEETIDFELLAEDDFGLQACGLEWQGEHLRATGKAPAKGERELAKGEPDENRLLEPVAFCPAVHGIEPQKILLRGWATDRLPGRGRIYSEPIVIYVLTRTEHAQILKQRFDRAISELEDLARRELNLLDENQRLEKLDGQKMQEEENRNRIDEQKREESETQRRTAELTEQMEQLLKDSVRNGDIDKEALRKMAEALKSMQELSQQDIPKVEQKLGQAGDPSGTPQKSKSEMSKAVEEQQKVVEKMRETI